MSWRDGVRAAVRAAQAYQLPAVETTVKLDANESPYPTSPELRAAILEALADVDLHRYPDPAARALRSAVSDDLGQAPERLVLGNGSDELLALLCGTFAEPRRGHAAARLVFPGPSFVVYRTAAIAAGMEVHEAPFGPRFAADPTALSDAIARLCPTLVFIASPNNPTGTAWPLGALAELVDAHTSTVIVIDEAYVAYSRSTAIALIERAPHCVILRTYSKIGLAGLRIGVLIAQPDLAREVEKVRGPYNLGVLPQRAAAVAISRFGRELERAATEVVAERERLAAALARPGVEVFPSAANLLLIRLERATAMWQALLDRSVLVRSFDRPGPLAGCLRITVGTPEENRSLLAAFDQAFAALAEA